MPSSTAETLPTEGQTMPWMPAIWYDTFLQLLTLGREKGMRRELLDLASIAPGERILDLACGTGTCAILAAEDTGDSGSVVGVDPNGPFLEQAKSKAKRSVAHLNNLTFVHGVAEAIPFPDSSFDVVLFVLAFHHLPSVDLQFKVLGEIFRVLRPGGRVLLVDFPQGDNPNAPNAGGGGGGAHSHSHSHSHFHLPRIGGGHGSRSSGGGCCTAQPEPDDYANDKVLAMMRHKGFQDVTAQSVRLVNAMAVTAHKASTVP